MFAPTRALVVVLDSMGIGELPDAASYGDQGSDTLGHIAAHVPLAIPNLRMLGLGRVAAIGGAKRRGGARGSGPDGRGIRGERLGDGTLGNDGGCPRPPLFRYSLTDFRPT